MRQVYKFNVPTFGPGVVFDVDVSIRTEQIRFFAESLKTEKLKSYVPLFVQEAEVGYVLHCIDDSRLPEALSRAKNLHGQTDVCTIHVPILC